MRYLMLYKPANTKDMEAGVRRPRPPFNEAKELIAGFALGKGQPQGGGHRAGPACDADAFGGH
jgi:hypothetical protein